MKTSYALHQLLLLTFFSVLATLGWGQTQVYSLDFESSGGYTTSITEFTDGSGDYFTRTDGSDISASFTNFQGASFFGAQDIDGEGAGLPAELTISEINVSGYSNLELRVFLAEDDDGSNQDWDGSDFVHINYKIDGGGVNNGIWIESSGGTNTEPAIDTDFDGIGDGTAITDAFAQFTTLLSSTGSSLDITIEFDLDSGDEDIAIDNIEVWGTPAGPTVGWDNPTRTETETNSTQTIQIPVSLTNYAQNVTLDVAVTGGTAESGDYTLNTTSLTFTGNGTQNVSLDINDDADVADETVEITLTESTATGVTINPNVHTLTILDDDLPTAFINEFHYDNVGADTDEFVEVAVINSFSGLLSDLTVTLYNGNGGSEYDSESLDQFMAGSSADGFTFYTWDPSSIQNGDPDGIAIDYQGTIIEFLSYGGSFTATNGPANGLTSSDVGVSETGSTPVGHSLQLTGNCDGVNCPAGLNWQPPMSNTKGAKNTMQFLPVDWLSFTAHYQPEPQAVQLDWSVAWEELHDFYEVQHSTDGNQWEPLARVRQEVDPEEAEGRRSPQKYYSYLHASPETGLNLYRIRQVDLDGSEDFSAIKNVLIQGQENVLIQGQEVAMDIAPNPAADRLFLFWPSSWDYERVSVELIDMSGQTHALHEGQTPSTLDVQRFPSGMYQLLIREPGGHIIAQKRLVIQ